MQVNKSNDRDKLYKEFTNAYVDAHPSMKRSDAFINAQNLWKEIKSDTNQILAKTKEFCNKKRGNRGSLDTFWLNAVSKRKAVPETDATTGEVGTGLNKPVENSISESQEKDTGSALPQSQEKDSDITSEVTCEGFKKAPTRSTPSQDKAKSELNDVNEMLVKLHGMKDTGLFTNDLRVKMEQLNAKKHSLEKKIKELVTDRQRKQKNRVTLKRTLEDITSENPDIAHKLKKYNRPRTGRPAIEDDQSSLLQVISEIATAGAAADSRRRSEMLQSCKTLDDLTDALRGEGFVISRSATYLRLMPHRSNTSEGKRHVNTVPVKLLRASNTAHKNHEDGHFATATIMYLKDMTAMLGSESVFFLSQDDKARVPIGLPAAHKQAPLLMHLEYKVQLPDHDWVIASQHKLIPSVYAACMVKDEVSYSGPTFIAIRSGKHDSTSARSHAIDFETLVTLPEFNEPMLTSTGSVKPVVIISVDGGPDENPRFPKTLAEAISTFKKFNLDAIFIATHAPGLSAYNAVERRMAPLSHDLSGLILPYDHYGTHLNSKHETVDVELEKKNFAKAGMTLAEVWEQTVIDGHPVVARYIDPASAVTDEAVTEPVALTEQWRSVHVRQSQYCLQIVKCVDETCCGMWRTNFTDIFPQRFLPPPVPFVKTPQGIVAADPNSKAGQYGSLQTRLVCQNVIPRTRYSGLPFDYYCPSVRDEIDNRVCTNCGIYFPSKVAVSRHLRVHKKASNVQVEVPEHDDIHEVPAPAEVPKRPQRAASIIAIRNMAEWLQSDFSLIE